MRVLRITALVVLLVTIFSGSLGSVQSQSSGWQTPQWIPGLVDTGIAQYPYFVVDPTGQVHVFHSQWVSGRYSIVYSSWNIGVGWSDPIDVIEAPYSQARIIGAFLDSTGFVNVFFWGGEDFNANIFFTKAYIGDVAKSSAWLAPELIGESALSPTTGGAVLDHNGRMVVVYSGNRFGNGVYGVMSDDGGKTWTDEELIYSAANDFLYPSSIQMLVSSNNSVHAVWALGDLTGNSRRVYHISLDPNSGTWTKPGVLAEAIGFEADAPNLIEYDGSLMAFYHNDSPTTRWMIQSFDNGVTWTAPVRLFEHVGSNGTPALVIDSANRLHMFFGNRIGNPPMHGLWHSQWTGNAWSVPESIVTGRKTHYEVTGEPGFDPTHAQVFAIRGNLLLVIWRQDDITDPQRRVWYSYRSVDAPELQAGVNAPPPPAPTEIVPTMARPTQTPTPRPTLNPNIPEKRAIDNLNVVLAVGIFPAIIVTVVILIVHRIRQ